MPADIVERLNVGHTYKEMQDEHGGLTIWPLLQPHEIDQVMQVAATEIAALRQQLAEAREALAQCEGALKAGGFEEGFAAVAARNWRERYPA